MTKSLALACASLSLLSIQAQSQCDTWQTLGPLPHNDPFDPTTDRIVATTTFDSGTGPELYVAVEWPQFGFNPGGARVYRRDGAAWTALGPPMVEEFGGLDVFDTGTGPALHAWGYLYHGVRGLARWNGSAWESVGMSFGEAIRDAVMFDDGSGPALHVTGHPWSVGSMHTYFARWNGSSWAQFGGVANTYARDLVVWDDGNGPALYAAGHFTTLGGVAITGGIARWDGTTWSSLGSGVAGPQGPQIDALAVYDDGSGAALYAGGSFTTAGGEPALRVAKWDGSEWSPLGGGVSGHVKSLLAHDAGDGAGPRLYVLGGFLTAGSVPVQGLAIWDGEQWSAPPAIPGGAFPSSALTEFVDPLLPAEGPALLVGVDQESLAVVLGGCGQTGELFCFGDGSGTACPCANSSGVGERVGCLHSFGTGGSLRGSGSVSLSNDTLVLEGAQMPNGSALYFQALARANGGAGVVFGDGLRCTTSAFIRLGTKLPTGGISQYPSGADTPVSVRGGVLTPGTRTYQIRYRNGGSFCTSAGFNMTNALAIQWQL